MRSCSLRGFSVTKSSLKVYVVIATSFNSSLSIWSGSWCNEDEHGYLLSDLTAPTAIQNSLGSATHISLQEKLTLKDLCLSNINVNELLNFRAQFMRFMQRIRSYKLMLTHHMSDGAIC